MIMVSMEDFLQMSRDKDATFGKAIEPFFELKKDAKPNSLNLSIKVDDKDLKKFCKSKLLIESTDQQHHYMDFEKGVLQKMIELDGKFCDEL